MDTTEARRKHYIGIDPSLCSTGVAILSVTADGLKRKTLCIAPPTSLPEPLRLSYLYSHAKSWIIAMTGYDAVSGACIEGPSYKSTGRQDLLGEVRGVFKLLLVHVETKDILVVAPASLKKFAAGSGGADKAGVTDAMRKRGWFGNTSDEFDAAALAEICYAKHNPEAVTTRKQAEVIHMKKKPRRSTRRTSGLNV